MSIRRLCVRISKCSWESLSLKGERITAYTFFSVGRGTGPETVAPVRVAVSTISLAAVSIAEWSYAFRRMRFFFGGGGAFGVGGAGLGPPLSLQRMWIPSLLDDLGHDARAD